jgi:hypothetical protein
MNIIHKYHKHHSKFLPFGGNELLVHVLTTHPCFEFAGKVHHGDVWRRHSERHSSQLSAHNTKEHDM